ncbi:MAG: flavodoxin family protein [Candidatus Adiutrix sp.]
MKVITINGSAKEQGNTSLALDAAAEVLRSEGIEVQRIDIGKTPINGCCGCGACVKAQSGQCARFTDDHVNEWIALMKQADGFIIGSPVYFAGINGGLKAFLDRAFFVSLVNGNFFRHKLGLAVAAVRRAGSLPTMEQITRYFSISEMIIPTGNYWVQVYGLTPGQAAQDDEGLQCIKVASSNMAWLMKLISKGRQETPPPPSVKKVYTNFIR